ncbi:MAG: c-type cytochrome [Myxococcota bacterium]
MKRPILYALLAIAAAAPLAPSSARAQAWQAKNLKILPKSLTKEQVKETMKKQADALGVDCDHCHAVPDMAKDTEKKEAARRMIRMVAETNEKFFKGKPMVECATCHRGKDKPQL